MNEKNDEFSSNKKNLSLDTSSISFDWNHTWGGIDKEFSEEIVIDSLDNIYVGGYTYSFGAFPNSKSELYLLKYNSLGDLQWNRTWGGDESEKWGSMGIDSSGNIYIAGITMSYGAENNDLCLVKYDSAGVFQWYRTWGGINHDLLTAIDIDSSDNIYITGYINFGMGNGAFSLLKYASSDTRLWNRTWWSPTYNTTNYELGSPALIIDSTNNVYLSGEIGIEYNFLDEYLDIFIVKFNNLGTELWNRILDRDKKDKFKAININSDDILFIVGTVENSTGLRDSFVAGYKNSGSITSYHAWGGIKDDRSGDIAIDSSYNIYLTGSTESFGAGEEDIYLVKWRSTTNHGPSDSTIPGYNVFILYGVFFIVLIIIIQRKYQRK